MRPFIYTKVLFITLLSLGVYAENPLERDYPELGKTILEVEYELPKAQVPDLRSVLYNFGSNLRPDADPEMNLISLGFKGMQKNQLFVPGHLYYVTYEDGHYAFTKGNTPSNLWIEPIILDGVVKVAVSLEDEEGNLIEGDQEVMLFQPEPKIEDGSWARNWNIDGTKVDQALLTRYKARWFGKDAFLREHGGEDYAFENSREKLSFGENTEIYNCYIKTGDTLALIDGKWVNMEPGTSTIGKPLMQVTSIEEYAIHFKLWDATGRLEQELGLRKFTDQWGKANVEKEFHFLSARSKQQWTFDVKGKHFHLKPQDWLLFTGKTWKKIESINDIDAYVNGELNGVLFVVDQLVKDPSGQRLEGHIFSFSRAEKKELVIVIQEGQGIPTPLLRSKNLDDTQVDMGSTDFDEDDGEIDEQL